MNTGGNVGGPVSRIQYPCHGSLDRHRLGLQTQRMPQQHRCSQHRRQGIGNPLPGDVRGTAVNWLVPVSYTHLTLPTILLV